MNPWQKKGTSDAEWRLLSELDHRLVEKVTRRVAQWLREDIEQQRERIPATPRTTKRR